MRSVLIGAVEGSDTALAVMCRLGLPPAAVVTLPPALGRARHADYVDLRALAPAGLPVIDVDDVNDEGTVAAIAAVDPDFIFVIGWSQLVKAPLRAVVRRGVIGFHPTLLPRLRGRAAIAWTILTAPATAGVSLFQIDGDAADTGPLIAQHAFPLDSRETAASLIEKNKQALERVLFDALPTLARDGLRAIPQDEREASVATRRTAADARIDWSQSASAIDRHVRAQSEPYAGAFTFTRKRRIRIWQARNVAPVCTVIGFPGQVIAYPDGQPLILCGDGQCLKIERYTADDPAYRLRGQLRFFDRMGDDQ